MAIAREPGSRSKVAVHSHRAEVDAVGACLGPEVEPHRGRLRRAARREDRHHPLVARPAHVHHNALAPAKVLGVELFEDEGVGLVTVPDYQLSLAIGREGQNVRLAARLTGWRLDITSESEAEETRAALPGRARGAGNGGSADRRPPRRPSRPKPASGGAGGAGDRSAN